MALDVDEVVSLYPVRLNPLLLGQRAVPSHSAATIQVVELPVSNSRVCVTGGVPISTSTVDWTARQNEFILK